MLPSSQAPERRQSGVGPKGSPILSLASYGEQSGDLMRDLEMRHKSLAIDWDKNLRFEGFLYASERKQILRAYPLFVLDRMASRVRSTTSQLRHAQGKPSCRTAAYLTHRHRPDS